jgi:predicted ATPase
MSIIHKDNYFILTGAMGAGKSTVINALRDLNLICIDEPARQILAEQRSIAGKGVPEYNPQLFTDLLLSRSIYQFKQMRDHHSPIIYDRGIADNIGYAKLFSLSSQCASNASKLYQYNKQVFFLPAWQEIYQNDEERKMTFKQAKQFGVEVKKIYEALGYHVIDVPLDTPIVRAEFIIQAIIK